MPTEDMPVEQQRLVEWAPQPGQPLGRGLTVLQQDGLVSVSLGSRVLYAFEGSDRVGRQVTVASLAHNGWATERDLAAVFGCHRNTVSRLKRQLGEGGLRELVPAKRGPKGPHKVTPAVRVTLVAGAREGQAAAAVQRRIAAETGVRLSHTHVRWLLKAVRPRGQQLALDVGESDVDGGLATGVGGAAETVPGPSETEDAGEGLDRGAVDDEAAIPSATDSGAAEEGDAAEETMEPPGPGAGGLATAPDGEPPVILPEGRGRYLGAALFFPALWALGLVDAARQCFRLPRSERFGVRAVTLTLFFLTLFGKSTLEAAKHLRRWEFGPLVGAGRAPSVKTLRRKLAELVRQAQALRFQELLARRWVEQGVIATAYLCVDGHVHAYAGKRKLQEVWNSKRRMPLPGVLTYFVNDLQGRPLLFLTEEANASLAQALPRVVEAIREVLGGRGFTLIFDRGGYDGRLFHWLDQEGIPFITYQRGEPNLALEHFRARWVRFEGRRVRLQIAEDQVRVGGLGPWRRVVVRTRDGHQTPILTSVAPSVPAPRVACLMFARWRQENFFKYSREHHGLDHLLGYAWAEADGQRLVPNPQRKELTQALRDKRAQLRDLRSRLGQAVLDEPRDSGRTVHGLKVSQGGGVGRVRALEQEIDDLFDRRAALPDRVPLKDAGPREILRLEQKEIIDRIKITAYNAEEWLLERLLPHYPHPDDIRDLLRAFAELSGEVHTTAAGVTITLDPPDTPMHRRALHGLCADLNQLGVNFPGTCLPVTYRVAMHHSETAA
jgi:transposase